MSIEDDLATLRAFGGSNEDCGEDDCVDCWPYRDRDAALSRVEAEIARLEQERDRFDDEAERKGLLAAEWKTQHDEMKGRAETAEAEVARLTALPCACDKCLDCLAADRMEAAEAEVARLERERHEDLVAHLNRASLLSDEVARLWDGLRRIANRYCLFSVGDSQQESVCEGKPISERCSVCVARALLADQDGAA